MGANFSLKEACELWGLERENPYSAMLLDFIEKHARQLGTEIPVTATEGAWLKRATGLKPQLLHSLGLVTFPERTPLDAQIVGEIDRTGYSIQKVIYSPRPGFPVSAHLYLPRRDASFPAPAVLYSPGHNMENCKLEPHIQLCCGNLARLGFVVLVYDPIGQGERLGDWLDHGHLEPLLVGLSQEGLMVWESMRAIDYLAGRPEVDPRRIGMTGSSGGGLNTFYTSAVDERVQVSVPVCYVNTFVGMMTAERDRNWEDGVDICNQVPRIMAHFEMSDISGLFAPKPLCVIAATRDWMFPIEGVREVYKNIEHIYDLVGSPSRVRLSAVEAEHGYDQEMRQVAYGWLTRWLKGEGDGSPIPEQECELLPMPYHPALTYIAPPDLGDLPILRQRASFPISSPGLCFPEGAAPPPGPAITALTQQMSDSLPPTVTAPTDPADWERQRVDLLERASALLGPFPERTLVSDRTFNQVMFKNVFAERVVFQSEPGIIVPAMFLAPAEWKAYLPAIVYVDEWGKSAGLTNGIIEALLEAKFAVLAIDVRGVGETGASDFEAATNALMTDRPLFGQRVWDVLRAVDYLWRRIYVGVQIDKGRIGCIGRGAGGLLALYAAALDQRLGATVVWEAPATYKSLIVERPAFPASVYLFDVLTQFDLPQLSSTVAPRPLLIADPVDGERQHVHIHERNSVYEFPRQVYKLLHPDAGSFEVLARPEKPTSPSEIANWLQKRLSVEAVSSLV